MVDKKINQDHDEYQFPSDEYVSSAEEHAKTSDAEPLFHEEEAAQAAPRSGGIFSSFSLLRNKRLLLVVGGAIVVLIIYKMMQPAAVKPIAVAPTPVPQTIVKQEVSPEMSSEISDLQQALQSNQSSINQLQTQLQSVNSALSQAAQNQASNQATIAALTKQVEALSAQVKILQAIGAKIPVAKFHVKAILSGRAWIVNSNGLEKTVRVGDIVPQYGEVIAIDPQSGQVTTNSGKIIRFGSNDV